MNAVADANIFILFARSRFFHLLPQLFDAILVTPEVYDEIVLQGAGRPGATEVKSTPEIRKQPVSRPHLLPDLTAYQLDAADASVILLALEQRPAPLLSDDRRVREIGQGFSLSIMGSGGLLVMAKARCLIPSVKPCLDQIKLQGARISPRTYADILQAAKE